MQIKSYCLAISLLIGAAVNAAAQNMSTTQYIDTYKNIAMEEMRRSGVPAAIKLAQGILETQSGNGWLVLNSNNHFGIKCKNNWAGPSVNYDDDARQECFRKYGSPAESWKDHSEFLRNNPRYKFLFDLNPEDYKAWAYGLKTAGYATSRTYPQQLIQIIETYQLQQFNAIAMGKQPIPASPSLAGDPGSYEPVQPSGRDNNVITPQPAAAKKYPVGTEFRINNRKVIFVKEGTALIQVASQYDIRLSSLLKYNDITEDQPLLEKDMLIFLQSKSKRGQNDYHIVAPGESLHDIAQAEGVQIRWLRKRNKLDEGDQPAAGEKVALDGYASSKPRLGSNSVAKVDDHKDLDPKQIIKDVKEEIAKATAAPEPAPSNTSARNTEKSSGIPPSMVEDLKKAGGSVTPAGSQYHTVTEKETLYSISRRYNITVAQLQQWNNLQDNGIRIGQQLVVRK
ncbi:glucosaminidase domain-containing protein [Chitinophaga barathri]|uniref:Peptidoglycan hydrolase n=1 Tax=Chitinophaga barathri TaxID=1647451 RepID=A0A3N4M6N7_9BACT|nr:glucosaminidase domain-containing protein [Chitinophaga barathri]RPD38941.1 LysM peptidoglycan-binding domain-containing protein [Chitinophaga barathri]